MKFATISAALILPIAMAIATMAGKVGGKTTDAGTTPSPPKSSDVTHSDKARDWPIYGGTSENNHYSPLTQINRSNVQQLKVAWSFDTEEPGGLQTSPIVVEGVL